MANKIKIAEKADILNRIDREGGLTLIEILVVIAIGGIVTAFALLATDIFQRESRVTALRDTLMSDLEFVRLRSITKMPTAIYFYPATSSALARYELMSWASLASDANRDFIVNTGDTAPVNIGNAEAREYNCKTPYAVIDNTATDNTAYCLPLSYSITLSNCDTNNQLWFDRKGIARCSSWANGLNTITLSRAGELNKTITIDSNGRIRYEQ